MKKNKLAILLFFLVSVSVFSFEGGGLVKTGLGFDLKNFKGEKEASSGLTNKEGISLWAKQAMDKNDMYHFSIQGSYLFKLSKGIKPNTKPSLQHILDIDLLKFSFLLPTKNSDLKIELGRYGLADITGQVFNQNVDGFFLSYESYKNLNFFSYFSLGYTGLLNSYTNPMNLTYIKPKKKTKLYNLSPSMIALTGLFTMPIGEYQHTINFELNSFMQTKKDGLMKNYFTFMANGPIYSNLFFILSTTGELRVKGNKGGLGMALNADMAYYLYNKSVKLGLKTQWFSGGKFYFDAMTGINTSKVIFVAPSDLWKTSLYTSIKPIDDLFIGFDVSVLCDGKKLESEKFYSGTEFNLALNYVLLSDIYMGMDAGVFLDNKGSVDTKINLKAMLSF